MAPRLAHFARPKVGSLCAAQGRSVLCPSACVSKQLLRGTLPSSVSQCRLIACAGASVSRRGGASPGPCFNNPSCLLSLVPRRPREWSRSRLHMHRHAEPVRLYIRARRKEKLVLAFAPPSARRAHVGKCGGGSRRRRRRLMQEEMEQKGVPARLTNPVLTRTPPYACTYVHGNSNASP